MKVIIAIAFLFFSELSFAGELKGIWLNREGARALKEQRTNDSYNYFAQSLAEIPFTPEAHFNLGTSYYANKEFDKAQKEFEVAAQLANQNGNKELEFLSHFSAGAAAGEAKQIDLALDSYQKALAVKPDSVEAKTNIELLTKSQAGGGGDDKDQKQKDGGQGNDQKQQQNSSPQNQQQQQQQKPQPKPFDSKEMTQQDVNRILEELKRQDEQIRAKFDNDKFKSAPNDKDW